MPANAACRFATERVQFGESIASMQGIQFMLADMATELESARLLTYKAADLKDNKQPFTLHSAMCKLKAAEAASFSTTKAPNSRSGV